MKQVEVKLILTYNDDEWHNPNPISIKWFKDFVLSQNSVLHSKTFNRDIGRVEIIEVNEKKV